MEKAAHKSITDNFPVTNDEYIELDKSFNRLCWHSAHELKRKNSRNNYTDDSEDIVQELFISMMKAGSYYKRQIYIENCLKSVKKYVRDSFMTKMVSELDNLWANRTRHGANRQKYGPLQEDILEKMVKSVVPSKEQPNKNAPLKIDTKFSTYCKAIIWNGQKGIGRKITKNKEIMTAVSLSESSFLI